MNNTIPPLVTKALEIAARMGFESSCTAETGRFLSALAASVTDGVIGEIGTGCGVGTAWLASGMRGDVRLVTVEADGARAEAVRSLFADAPRVKVIHGDWREVLEHGPFALLFVDAAPPKREEPEPVVEALCPGGIVVLDDLTPPERQPPEWRGRKDPVRDFWLHHPKLLSTEIRVSEEMAVILATRT